MMSSSSLVHCSTTTRSTILTYCYLLHLLHYYTCCMLHLLLKTHTAALTLTRSPTTRSRMPNLNPDSHPNAHPNQVSDDEKPYA